MDTMQNPAARNIPPLKIVSRIIRDDASLTPPFQGSYLFVLRVNLSVATLYTLSFSTRICLFPTNMKFYLCGTLCLVALIISTQAAPISQGTSSLVERSGDETPVDAGTTITKRDDDESEKNSATKSSVTLMPCPTSHKPIFKGGPGPVCQK